MIQRIAAAAVVALAVGCTEQSTRPAAEATVVAKPVVFNAAGHPTVELDVPNMMCEESCAVKVKEVLAEQPGAADVKIDFPAKKAFVAIEGEAFDVDAAITALADHGFDDTQVVDKAAAPEADPEESPATEQADEHEHGHADDHDHAAG